MQQTSDAGLHQESVSRETALAGSVALDQWRGLALVLVLISHGFYFTNRVHGIGRVGVNLFFFISGILVFKSLNKAVEKNEPQVGLRFWKKRLLRLYPALFLYVGLTGLQVYVLGPARWLPVAIGFEEYKQVVPVALLYVVNYVQTPTPLHHIWSLSCEMQLYHLAPLIFKFGGKSLTQRNAAWGSLTLGLLVLGFLAPFLAKGESGKFHFEFSVWPMMLGFFLEFSKATINGINAEWRKTASKLSVVILCLSLPAMLLGGKAKLFVIGAGILVFLPCFNAYLANQAIPGVLGRALAWLGIRTYSIYLWQQPLTLCGYLPLGLHPLGALLAIPIGALSFRYFEVPFLTRRRAAPLQERTTV